MFGFFKKKSKVEVLLDQYKKLQEEAYRLSSIDRKAADAKVKEAEDLLAEIEKISQAG